MTQMNIRLVQVYTLRCQTNVGTCLICGWTDPTQHVVLSLHNVYALSLDLRLTHILNM